MRFLFTIMLLLATQCFAQIGGTQAVDDTMRLANKFAVYKVDKGQRLDASTILVDSLIVETELKVPQITLPSCEVNTKGNIAVNTSNNRLYFCDGTSWNIIASIIKKQDHYAMGYTERITRWLKSLT